MREQNHGQIDKRIHGKTTKQDLETTRAVDAYLVDGLGAQPDLASLVLAQHNLTHTCTVTSTMVRHVRRKTVDNYLKRTLLDLGAHESLVAHRRHTGQGCSVSVWCHL